MIIRYDIYDTAHEYREQLNNATGLKEATVLRRRREEIT
jgi:hypothetical protein